MISTSGACMFVNPPNRNAEIPRNLGNGQKAFRFHDSCFVGHKQTVTGTIGYVNTLMRNYSKHGRSQIWRSSVVRSVEEIDLFWELLVAYANLDAEVPKRWKNLSWIELVPAHKSSFDRLAHLLLASGLVLGLSQIEAEFDPNEPGIPEDLTQQIFHTTSKQLKHQHAVFKKVLTWLCSPKIATSPDIRKFTIRKMKKIHPRGTGALVWGRYPTIDEEDERMVAYLEKHSILSSGRRLYLLTSSQGKRRLVVLPDRWRDAVDPFCAFVLEQSLGKQSKELPVRVCARRVCGRFFLPARNTGKFCSDSCRATDFWTAPKRREYMRMYRLGKLSRGARRKKSRQPSVRSPER
jgi:hypothetical protein